MSQFFHEQREREILIVFIYITSKCIFTKYRYIDDIIYENDGGFSAGMHISRTDGRTRIFSCAITRRFTAGGVNSRRFNEGGGAIVVMFMSSWVKGHRRASVRPQATHSFAFRVPYIYACSFSTIFI